MLRGENICTLRHKAISERNKFALFLSASAFFLISYFVSTPGLFFRLTCFVAEQTPPNDPGEGTSTKNPLIVRVFPWKCYFPALVRALSSDIQSACIALRDFSNCLCYRLRYISSIDRRPALRNLR